MLNLNQKQHYFDAKIKHKNQSENVTFHTSKIFIENTGVGVMSV